VAASLGNTPAICRKCYIHPEVIGAYLDAGLVIDPTGAPTMGLRPEEAAVMAFLASRAG
jgi:DNA topoisomerase-1